MASTHSTRYCTECKKSYSTVSSLRMHVKQFHPEKLQVIAPKKNYLVKAVCNECNKTFTKRSNFTQHVKKFHADKIQDLLQPKVYNHECDDCGKHFTHLRNFNSHRKCHNGGTVKPRKQYKCSMCNADNFTTKSEIWLHFESLHNIILKSEVYKFSKQDDFLVWKNKMEKETLSSFIKEHGCYTTKTYTCMKYVCHRSGFYKTEGKGLRNLKKQGSNKINGFCPAEISVKLLGTGECEVNFIGCHVGHEDNLHHLTLSKSDRETLATKISLKIPFENILDEVRESISEDQLERLHLLTRKDLYNIEQCFNLNKESVRHVNDAGSVEAWVRENTRCVLFYKPQDVKFGSHEELKDEDFVLIIMNQGQTEILDKYGNDCICIDGIDGVNSHQFELISLLVLDDMREGFPCAFCITNRSDEVVMKIFFSCIQEKLSRNLQAKVFMSDMDQCFYNAWQQVMGPVEFRLLCSWHIDRAWQKDLCKISSKEKQIDVYKQLQTLLQESDVNTFISMCDNFTAALLTDIDTVEFGIYFQECYLKNAEEWAYCYQLDCGLNTNMHIERMHRTLEYIYLNEKVAQRLDKAIYTLMKFVRDRLFERIIVINKDEVSTKIKNLKARHKASLSLDDKLVVATNSGWQVPSSSSNETYIIEERQPHCNCKLVCADCNVCLHRYSCTCLESSIKWNMCKHIHLVCRFINMHSDGLEELEIDNAENLLTIEECEESNNYSEEEFLAEDTESYSITEDKRKTENDAFSHKKDKLQRDLVEIIASITSNEQLEAYAKLVAPLKATMVSIKNTTKI